MPEGRIDDIVNESEVSKQLDALYDRLFKVVSLIRTINAEGGKINLNKGLSESTIAAQQAKAATEELKRAKADLAKQEQAVKLAAQQAAVSDAARSRAAKIQAEQQKKDDEQKRRDIKLIDEEAASAAKRQKERDDSAARQRKAAREAAEEARKKAARDAKIAATGEEGSLNNLKKSLSELRKEYNLLGPAAREALGGKDMLAQIQALDKQVKKLEGEQGIFNRNVGNYPKAADVVGGVESVLAVAGISAGASAIFQSNYEVSDKLGDLQRILGGTAKESDKLLESLKKLDTRTSVSGLLNIATIAAKAGVASKDIVGVTKAIDQLVVVLGSELGDADQVTESLVKLVNVFSKDGRVTGEALSSIGNAILELANAGVASGPFLVDYAQRLAGVAKTANFALSAALGLAAGFEEQGQSAEVAGTATTTILSKIATDVPKFAKLAGKSVEEFTKTLREKPAEAIIEVSAALVKGKKGFDDIASAAKDVEAKGRVSTVLGVIGANADKFREKIELAAKALGDTANISDQFAIKNNTLAGSVDKLKNAIINLTTNPNSQIGLFFKALVDGANKAIYTIDILSKKIVTGLSKYDPENFDAANISKVAKNERGFYTPVEFQQLYQGAIADKKEAQTPFVNAFEKKTREEQIKDVQALKQAIREGSEAFKIYAKEQGLTSEITIQQGLSLEGLTFRLKEYARLQQVAANEKPLDTSVSAKELTDKEKAKLKKQAEERARAREKEIQAEQEGNKFDLQVQIEAQKTIIDNEKASLEERLLANDEYYKLKDKLASDDIAYQKEKVKQEIGVGKAPALELATLDKKLEYEKQKNLKESGNNVYKILSDNADEQTKKIIDEGKKQQEAVELLQNVELAKTQKYYTTGQISKEQYEDEKLRITNKYAILELQSELDTQQQVLEIMKQRGLPVEEQESKLLAIRNKIRDLDLKFFDDSEKNKTEREVTEARKREELRKKEIEGVKQLAKESVAAIFSIFDANFENQKNAVQDQMDLLDKNTQKELKAVDDSTDSAQSKADKIAVINARAASQKDTLERRQRQIDQEKARFDRLKAIGEILAGTAVNIVKVFPNPVLIALAAAVGGAQLAQVLATPIPRYKHGVINHPGGAAEVNDGSELEVMESPTGRAFVAKNKNAIVDLPAHYRVHASLSDYYRNSSNKAYTVIPTADKSVIELKAITDQITKGYEKQTAQILQGLENNKTTVNVNNTWSGLTVNAQKTTGKIEYLNRNIFN